MDEVIKERKLSGNTYKFRNYLKSTGARWDSAEKSWYVHADQFENLQTAIDRFMEDQANDKAAGKALDSEEIEALVDESTEMVEVWLGYIEKTLEDARKWYPKGETRVEAHRRKLRRFKVDTTWIDEALRKLISTYQALPESKSKAKASPSGTLLKRLGFASSFLNKPAGSSKEPTAVAKKTRVRS